MNTENIETEQNKRFRTLFNFEKSGFYDVVHFIDADIGFSCKRDFPRNRKQNFVSQLGLYISPKFEIDNTSLIKPLFVSVSYGEKTERGLRMRSAINFLEPLDLEFRDEYFYEPSSNRLFKGKKEISGNELLDEVYRKHIQITKPVRGLWLRTRIRVWRTAIYQLCYYIAWFFHYLLLIISGDRYTFSYLFGEGKLNNKIVESNRRERLTIPEERPTEIPGKKIINVFGTGLEISQWTVIVYALLHLAMFFGIQRLKFDPLGINDIFESHFFSLVYIIVSFWFMETVIPFLLKKLIKYFSIGASLAKYKVFSV